MCIFVCVCVLVCVHFCVCARALSLLGSVRCVGVYAYACVRVGAWDWAGLSAAIAASDSQRPISTGTCMHHTAPSSTAVAKARSAGRQARTPVSRRPQKMRRVCVPRPHVTEHAIHADTPHTSDTYAVGAAVVGNTVGTRDAGTAVGARDGASVAPPRQPNAMSKVQYETALQSSRLARLAHFTRGAARRRSLTLELGQGCNESQRLRWMAMMAYQSDGQIEERTHACTHTRTHTHRQPHAAESICCRWRDNSGE